MPQTPINYPVLCIITVLDELLPPKPIVLHKHAYSILPYS